MTDSRILFSKKAAAEMLDLSVRTVDYLLASGELEYRKVGRKVLIPRVALTRFAGSDHSIERKQSKIGRTRVSQPSGSTQPTLHLPDRQELSAQNRGRE
jgi:excisionase family DNA binding protein